MNWKAETNEEYQARVWRWRSWFAWHPVDVGGVMVWLQWVERQKVFQGIYTHVDYRMTEPKP
jgi:hypothetical protein